ncbi:hypothetical protein [Actinocorallia libanotica]|uniref:Phage tail protein n=1 Tax=Actinocorallia libanotica TaxID=46162 RepID=A0ABN1Q5R0_9ACTN
MAGNNANEIRVAGTGRVLVAPLNTAVPTDTTAPWAAGWKDLGFTGNDGVKFTKKDKIDQVETWQSTSPARLVYSQRDLTVKFGLLQLNEDTVPFFFGSGSVEETSTSGTFSYDLSTQAVADERMLGIEFTDGAAVKYRFIVPRGQVTDNEDLTLVNTAAIKLAVTYTALAPTDGSPLATWLMTDPSYATA